MRVRARGTGLFREVRKLQIDEHRNLSEISPLGDSEAALTQYYSAKSNDPRPTSYVYSSRHATHSHRSPEKLRNRRNGDDARVRERRKTAIKYGPTEQVRTSEVGTNSSLLRWRAKERP